MSRKEFLFTCELMNGLHARPASYLVKESQCFESSVELENLRSGRKANMKSALSLIAADIAYQDMCRVVITGSDAVAACKKLRAFIFRELPKTDETTLEVRSAGALPPSLRVLEMRSCRGQATGEGWARGKPVCLKEYRFLPIEDHAVYAGVTGERLRLLGAMEQVQSELKEAVSKAEILAEREVLKAHLTLSGDPDFKARLLDHVDNGLSVAESIDATLEHFSQVLASSESGYLRDRVVDIRDLCDQILRLSYGSGRLFSPDILTQNSVCLADNLTPSQFLGLDKRYLQGLVLESGGRASHTVLLAQARGIPVVLGAEGARELMHGAREVVLDARLGLVIADPPREVNRYYQQELSKQKKLSSRCQPFIDQKAMTADGYRLEIGANIVGVEDASVAFATGAEGVGLFRTEMLYMERTQAPSCAEQSVIYSQVLKLSSDKPVIIRTMDVGADKPVDYFNLPEEQNPFLGYRAIRLYPEFLELFKDQMKALLQSALSGNLSIMIPMVSTVGEVVWVKEVLDELRDEMRAEGRSFGDIKLGIMIEVPSVCMIIDQLAPHVDFFSIGSNDLAQYFLAADRDNERVGNLYSYLHPSFLRLLSKVVTDARTHSRWVGLCGDMATDTDALPLLVGLGLNEISLPGLMIPAIKERLSHLNSQDCQALVKQAQDCEFIDQVVHLLQQARSDNASRPLLSEAIIRLDLDCLSKEEAIKELVDMLFLDGRVSDNRLVEESVWKRESVYSTGLGSGIAIPHCQSDMVYSHSVAVARLQKPVEWQSMDGQPVDTIFLLAVKDTDPADQHMKVFANLARKLVNEDFLKQFRACTDEREVVKLLQMELELAH